MQRSDFVQLLEEQIRQHQAELAEVRSYIEEQEKPADKVLPSEMAYLLETYIAEDKAIVEQIKKTENR